jgi:class 3 adenylate cyclase
MTIDARIEYVTTDDGVSLACTKFGSGPALIYQFANPSSSYFEMELAFPPAVETYEALARFATVVRYDSRNTGLSTRGVEDVSIEAHVRDLEAVREHFGFSSMALMFPFVWARVAVEYAAANPDRITALLLPYPMLHHERRPYAHLTDDILKAAMAAGPELYATISAAIWSGLDEQANTAWIARYSMESADFEDRMRCEAILSQHDARAAAANVHAPTLIIHRKLPQYNAGPSSAEMIREHRASITRLSAAIPGAETALFEGSSLWYSGDEAITARSIDFLQKVFARLSSPRAERAQAHAPSGTAIILFTDIADSTALTERLGDARFRDASRALDAGLRSAIREAGGEAIEGKLLGDGVLATFASTAQAIDGARRCLALSAASELGLHIGLHAGDVIREDNNVFGGAVNIASRICGLSAPGEILVSDVVRGMGRSSAGVEFEDRGEHEMKGVGEAVRVYAVVAGGEG